MLSPPRPPPPSRQHSLSSCQLFLDSSCRLQAIGNPDATTAGTYVSLADSLLQEAFDRLASTARTPRSGRHWSAENSAASGRPHAKQGEGSGCDDATPAHFRHTRRAQGHAACTGARLAQSYSHPPTGHSKGAGSWLKRSGCGSALCGRWGRGRGRGRNGWHFTRSTRYPKPV
jgi:hypothetical protein